MKFESKHNAHEKLHKENVGFEALEERCNSAVLRRQRVWKQICNATYPFVRSVLHVVQRHLANCRKHIASCAKVPCKLSKVHCKQCKGALQIVRSTLQAVQRHLANCQKRIARCAKVPCKLSEVHCKLQINVFIIQRIKKLKVFTTKIITYYYDEFPSFKRPGAGIGDIRRSQ